LVDENLELTLLMPCLDEARTVGACVGRALAFLKQHGVRGEVLVADNGSRDDSGRSPSAMGARVVNVAEKGYGAALLGGIRAARGRYVVMGDSDGSYDWSNVMPFAASLAGRLASS
jgi:glycosyltransferase involved in cell wall biosynthesis